MIDSEKISRFGAYGMVFKDQKLLLAKKKSGPYKDLWDFPGGGIEYGETPEFTLKREFLEEVAMQTHHSVLLKVITSNCEYVKGDKTIGFHHIGIIYKVDKVSPLANSIAREEFKWVHPKETGLNELTPFVKYMFEELKLI